MKGIKRIKINVDVVYFEEKDVRLAYIPTLDLCGYGNTLKEANDSLKIVLEEYFNYAIEKNTLEKDLKKNGWNLSSSGVINTPSFADALKKKNDLPRILKGNFSKQTKSYSIAL